MAVGAANDPKQVFLDIEGVEGEPTSSNRPGQIQLFSFNWGVSMPVTGGAGVAKAGGRPVMRDFTITKPYDITSPSLMLKCARGEEIKSIKLQMCKMDTKGVKLTVYGMYTMEQCLVTSVSVDHSVDPPVEVVSFNFQRITQSYSGSHGSPSASWNLKENSGK